MLTFPCSHFHAHISMLTFHIFITELKIHHLYSLITRRRNLFLSSLLIAFLQTEIKNLKGMGWGDNFEIMTENLQNAVMKRFYLLK